MFINAIHVIPRFTPQRIVTEWVIALNAVLCTLLVFALPPLTVTPRETDEPACRWKPVLIRTALAGLAGALTASLLGYSVRVGLFGNGPTGNIYTEHIRFGPNNTNDIR
ncbi:MAG: hypothetical protein GEU99_20370 [Luteitalea sp.]|nr:hypothetical protein [Luteitalea sp.]